jgi:hypothetical protein
MHERRLNAASGGKGRIPAETGAAGIVAATVMPTKIIDDIMMDLPAQ